MFFIAGHFPRIPRCFLRKRMRNLAVNLKPVATNSLWTNKRCVCVCAGCGFVLARFACCMSEEPRGAASSSLTVVCCFTERSDSRQREPDAVLVWSHRPVLLHRDPALLHHHLPWRYTQTCLHVHVGTMVFWQALTIRAFYVGATGSDFK